MNAAPRHGLPAPATPVCAGLTGAAGIAILVALTIAGCATPEPERAPAPTPVPTPPPATKPTLPPPVSRTKPGPIPVKPLNVKADCSFRDETGYQGAMKLDVTNAQVRRFEASVDIPRRGNCRFDLKDFQQTGAMPSIVLKSQGSRCVVRMWEQGRRVTVAFDSCNDMCTGDAFTYLWPFLADAHNGSCG
jgi:hypothetical protein